MGRLESCLALLGGGHRLRRGETERKQANLRSGEREVRLRELLSLAQGAGELQGLERPHIA